jgi:preprotein translocase subunit SecE
MDKICIPLSRLKTTGKGRISRRQDRRTEAKMAKTTPIQFVQQVRSEVAKVVWPTRREVVLTTIMVFVMAALTATFFSLVDIAIKFGLGAIVNNV